MHLAKFVAAALALAFSDIASAMDDLPYRDDRSTPQSLIESYYNAINRGEYSRAYTYFTGGADIGSYDDFAAGFEDTASVEVMAGEASEDAAMSKVFYALPVAIDAEARDGTHRQYAGCYVLRLTNSQVQDPPAVPMQIEQASLKPAEGHLEDILPKSCEF